LLSVRKRSWLLASTRQLLFSLMTRNAAHPVQSVPPRLCLHHSPSRFLSTLQPSPAISWSVTSQSVSPKPGPFSAVRVSLVASSLRPFESSRISHRYATSPLYPVHSLPSSHHPSSSSFIRHRCAAAFASANKPPPPNPPKCLVSRTTSGLAPGPCCWQSHDLWKTR
jgi:hypothetical protein